MAGKVKRLIDELVQLRTGGQAELDPFVRVHLVLNGIEPSDYNESSPDNPGVESTLRKMIDDFKAGSSRVR